MITTRAWEGGPKEHRAKQRWPRETHSVTYVPGVSTLSGLYLSLRKIIHLSRARNNFYFLIVHFSVLLNSTLLPDFIAVIAARKKQGPFSIAIGNMELMHERFPKQVQVSAVTKAILGEENMNLHSRNNSSRNEDAYAKGSTLDNNKNSQARGHIP